MRRFKKREKFFYGLIGLLLLIALVGNIVVPDTTILQRSSVTVTRWYRRIGKKQVLVGPSTHNWTKYNRVSKHMFYAIVAAEDSKFYQHSGLDFVEIFKSARKNIQKGEYVRGGSTITQQVVKMALLSRDKTIWRKVQEAAGALRL